MHTVKVYYINVSALLGLAASVGLAVYLFWPRDNQKQSK